MARCLMSFFAIAALSGCFTSGGPEPVKWTVNAVALKTSAASARAETVRISHLAVRPPFDSRSLTVLRSDGSIAFDYYNQFALAPSVLLMPVALDMLCASGKFKAVLPSSSSARADFAVEISVDRFALDCRGNGARKAVVAVTVRAVRDRALVMTVKGEAEKAADDGRYTAAFSEAFAEALLSAVSGM